MAVFLAIGVTYINELIVEGIQKYRSRISHWPHKE